MERSFLKYLTVRFLVNQCAFNMIATHISDDYNHLMHVHSCSKLLSAHVEGEDDMPRQTNRHAPCVKALPFGSSSSCLFLDDVIPL